MRRARLKYGVYEERRKSKNPRRVVLLETGDEVWIQFNGTNYPAVVTREFNSPNVVKVAMTEFQFRDAYVWVGKYTTHVTRKEVLELKR